MTANRQNPASFSQLLRLLVWKRLTFSRVEANDQEQYHAMRISRSRRQTGVLCRAGLLRPDGMLRADDLLRADELLCADRLLHPDGLLCEHRVLCPAAAEE
jgi:hypothetical protein